MRLTFLSKGALKKTVTRFRGPDRPWRRPLLTSRFARGVGLLNLDISFVLSPPQTEDEANGDCRLLGLRFRKTSIVGGKMGCGFSPLSGSRVAEAEARPPAGEFRNRQFYSQFYSQ